MTINSTHLTIAAFERILTCEGGCTPATIRSYVTLAAQFTRWYAQHRPDTHVLDATDSDIAGYLAELDRQGRSASTRRHVICALRSFYRCCGSPMDDNPAAAIALPMPPRPKPRADYQMSELLRIMDSARTTADTTTGPGRHRAHRDALIVELQCLYPVRPREIAGLRISDVGDRQLTIGTHERRRTLPLSDATATHLRDYLTDHRPHLGDGHRLLHTGNVDPAARVIRLLRRHGTAADLPGPHTPTRVRRSLIHILIDGGLPLDTVAYLAGIRLQRLVTLIWARDRDVNDDLARMIDAWHAPDSPDATEPPAAA